MKEPLPKRSNSADTSDLYEPIQLEERWQKSWETSSLNRTPEPKDGQRRFYALSMFPYPSGSLHMGHVRNYVITDVIARMQKMRGAAVLHPMGWDAFGLPAENAAIDRGIDPAEWTLKNIDQMKTQLNRLGLSIDWDREQTTCISDYYKWTQYLFLELFEEGLAYQKKSTVNWDPIDETVLANEQVDSEGKSWRSGAIVEKRKLKQWFLKITNYAEDLLADLEELNNWPDRVKRMQENWIGKSKGLQIRFKLESNPTESLSVFTTRSDTIFGVSYLVISPDHPITAKVNDLEFKSCLKEFKNNVKLKNDNKNFNDNDPKGLSLGINAINPINNKKIPIWIADYVLSDYGEGAVMAVPAHDKRDFNFAKRYNLTIIKVIESEQESNNKDNSGYSCWEGNGLLINSSELNGLKSSEAQKEILHIGTKYNWAKEITQYKLRDWLISRQRYWGCPIPIIHCNTCGPIAIEKSKLPLKLPKDIGSIKNGKSSLKNINSWVSTVCPKCGKKANRETDTMDTFMCSSWYYFRFIDPKNNEKPFDGNIVNKWLPVNQYVGGIEHAILHLLYSRFITKALKKRNLHSVNEPFKKLLTQGMVQGVTYKNKRTGSYVIASKVNNLDNPTDPDTGDKLDVLYEKMSKSKYNGIDPSVVINKYGADTARMFILFKAPPEKDLEWDDADVEGQYRFLQRVWKLVNAYKKEHGCNIFSQQIGDTKNNLDEFGQEDKDLNRILNNTIKSITEDLDIGLQFNTAISELMKLTNAMSASISCINKSMATESVTKLIRLLAPFAPHITEELWRKLGGVDSIHLQSWPIYDKEALKEETFDLIIQVKGKVRGKIAVSIDLSKKELEDIALESDIAKKWIKDATPSRIIVVPGKLVNLVP